MLPQVLEAKKGGSQVPKVKATGGKKKKGNNLQSQSSLTILEPNGGKSSGRKDESKERGESIDSLRKKRAIRLFLIPFYLGGQRDLTRVFKTVDREKLVVRNGQKIGKGDFESQSNSPPREEADVESKGRPRKRSERKNCY